MQRLSGGEESADEHIEWLFYKLRFHFAKRHVGIGELYSCSCSRTGPLGDDNGTTLIFI